MIVYQIHSAENPAYVFNAVMKTWQMAENEETQFRDENTARHYAIYFCDEDYDIMQKEV